MLGLTSAPEGRRPARPRARRPARAARTARCCAPCDAARAAAGARRPRCVRGDGSAARRRVDGRADRGRGRGDRRRRHAVGHLGAARRRAHEGRVRLGRQPRAAHPADVDPRLARPARLGPLRRAARRRRSGSCRSPSATPTGSCGWSTTSSTSSGSSPARPTSPSSCSRCSRCSSRRAATSSAAASSRRRPVVLGEELDAAVDADLLVQALTNLIANAVKFSPAGAAVDVDCAAGRRRGARRCARPRPRHPPDRLARIFERFEQVDASDAREKGGTGLGLAITRSIATRPRRPRAGRAASRAAGARSPSPLPRGLAGDDGSGRWVVLVEDDVDLSEVLAAGLSDQGFDVAVARTEDEAVALVQRLRPAAAPARRRAGPRQRLRGRRAAAATTRRWSDTRVVVATVHDLDEERPRPAAARATTCSCARAGATRTSCRWSCGSTREVSSVSRTLRARRGRGRHPRDRAAWRWSCTASPSSPWPRRNGPASRRCVHPPRLPSCWT